MTLDPYDYPNMHNRVKEDKHEPCPLCRSEKVFTRLERSNNTRYAYCSECGCEAKQVMWNYFTRVPLPIDKSENKE